MTTKGVWFGGILGKHRRGVEYLHARHIIPDDDVETAKRFRLLYQRWQAAKDRVEREQPELANVFSRLEAALVEVRDAIGHHHFLLLQHVCWEEMTLYEASEMFERKFGWNTDKYYKVFSKEQLRFALKKLKALWDDPCKAAAT